MSGDDVRVLALIPARGGSKGIPGKNLRRVGGITLIERAVLACRACEDIDAVVVSTDDDAIATAARRSGADVVLRPAELASDTASSESVLIHALDTVDPTGSIEVLVFVQCTSPFIDPADLSTAVEMVRTGAADSTLAATATYEFIWRDHHDHATGINHDPTQRPRRQDMEPSWRETGAFYAMSAPGFHTHQHRFFGRTRIVPVAPELAIDIDDDHDLTRAQLLAATSHHPHTAVAGLDTITAVVTDFDGVHTDDHATVDQHGTESVRISRADGLGLSRLRAAGLKLLILSTETNPVVRARAQKLSIDCIDASTDKVRDLHSWLTHHHLDPAHTVYIGNDINDLDALAMVGWPATVADARPEVTALARLVTSRPGGNGALRELADLILKARQ